MRIFVAGMLVLILLAVILAGWSVMVLERETRRQCCALREALAEVRGELEGVTRRLAEGSAREPEERMPAAMLEGFDNLMSYTERTARGERS